VKKIFGTDGIRCIVNQEPMTAEICLQIAKITGYLLSFNKKGKKRVVISKDTRLSGYCQLLPYHCLLDLFVQIWV
jgi:phosphomannomutase